MTAGWLLRRLGAILLVLLIVSFTVFGITQLLPGNAAVMILGEFATADQRHAMELSLGLDHPWWQQYLHWLGRILRGDWGNSVGLSRPVIGLIGDALGRSGLLAAATLVLVCVIATPIGVAGALLRGTLADLVIGLFAYLGSSVPEFVTATLLLEPTPCTSGVKPPAGSRPASDPATATPRLVICDEVTSALDVVAQAEIVRLLVTLQAAHATACLFIARDLNLVRQIAHRVAVMYRGDLVDLFHAAHFGTEDRHPYTRALLAAVARHR